MPCQALSICHSWLCAILQDAYMMQHVGADPDIPVRRMAQLLYQHRPAGSVVCLEAVQYDRWRRRLRRQLSGLERPSTAGVRGA